jgi:chemotaxis response regulator CheB
MGVVLTGGDGDGALGLRAIKVHGGVALVQSPDEAVNRSMPTAAIACDTPLVFPVEKIAERVRAFCLV